MSRTPRHDPEIKDAAIGDAPVIARLHRMTFDATYPTFPALHTPEEDLEHFKEVIRHNRVLIALWKGNPAAYCAFGPGWLHDLYVDPLYQGRGLGTLLLNTVKAENRELQLWTFQENARAPAFYERHGFTAEEETDGCNDEGQPDVRYEWRQFPSAG